jgi:cytoskeleton protein RodZ
MQEVAGSSPAGSTSKAPFRGLFLWPVTAEFADMFDIGATLVEAREKRKLSLPDAQKELRVRERYLAALEAEQWDVLPGEAYTRAFLRSYAEFLGLDGTLYVDEYNERIAVNADAPFVPDSLAREGGSRILFRTTAGVIAVAAVVAALVAFGSSGTTSADVQAAVAATPQVVARPGAIAHLKRWAPPKRHLVRIPTAHIRAVGGRSWFSVRAGGPHGREVFRGFLNRGHTLTYRLNRAVWMRVGRPHVVAIRVGAHVVRGLPGDPANLLLTKRGATRD